MVGRNRSEVRVAITGEADFTSARRSIDADFRRIERDAEETVDDIRDEFRGAQVSIGLDTSDLADGTRQFEDFAARLRGSDVDINVGVELDEVRRAFDLAARLDAITAEIDVTADISDVREAERLAGTLRSFVGRIDLDVEGRADLLDALGLAEKLDQLRTVRVAVQGRQELERAEALADGLERRRTVPVEARAEDLIQLDEQFEAAGGSAAQSFTGAFSGGFDLRSVGQQGLDQLTGVLSAAGPIGAAAAGVAAVFGDEFLDGFEASLSAGRTSTVRALRTGLSDADMAAVGVAAGESWSAGFGEGLEQIGDVAAIVQSELGGIDTNLDLSEATSQAQAFADVFQVDVGDAVRVAQRLIANDLVADTDEAFNLMARGAQDFGLQTQDAFDGFVEFSPVFRKLGVDGAQAFAIVGRQIDEGLVPSVDRAFEQFEEFNVLMQDGGARDSVEALGLSFDELQSKVANGQGAEALSEIAGALASMEDQALAAELAVGIFGASVESAADPRRVFELLATADAVGQVGDEADKMVAALESTQSPFDRLKRDATDIGALFGGEVRSEVERFYGGLDLLATGFDRLTGSTSEVSGLLGDVGAGFAEAEALASGVADGLPVVVEGLEATAVAGQDAADGIEETSDAIDGLLASLGVLFDFSADELLRAVAEAGIELAESFVEVEASAIGTAGAIDITAAGGAELQAQLENVNAALIDSVSALADGTITAAEFNRIQAQLEGQLAESGAQAGLTATQIDGLRRKYLDLPPSVVTQIVADPSNAQRIVDDFVARNQRLTLAVSFVGPTGSRIVTAGDLKFRAKGGTTSGLTVVGEEGPELVDFSGKAFVYTADQTRQILDSASADPVARASSTAAVADSRGRSLIENATIMVAPGRDLWQDLALAEQMALAGVI